jgi:hypothetical protein
MTAGHTEPEALDWLAWVYWSGRVNRLPGTLTVPSEVRDELYERDAILVRWEHREVVGAPNRQVIDVTGEGIRLLGLT